MSKLWKLLTRGDNRNYALVSSGTQYIDTGVKAASDLRIIADIETGNPVSGVTVVIFGSRDTNTPTNAVTIFSNVSATSNGRSDYATGAANTIAIPRTQIPFNTNMTIDKNRNQTFINGVLVANHGTASFIGNSNITLFAVNTGGVISMHCSFKMKACKIYSNDTLVRDFVPVPAGSTRFSGFSAPSNCLWDKVTQAYFQNAGTGSFGIETV